MPEPPADANILQQGEGPSELCLLLEMADGVQRVFPQLLLALEAL